MTDKYKISDETFRSVFKNVPHQSRISCLKEMKGVIDSYIAMIEEHGDIQFEKEGGTCIFWCDDNTDNAPIDFVGTNGKLVKTYGGVKS